MVSAERQARSEAMRVKSKRIVEDKRWTTKEEAAQMEAERRATVMKTEGQNISVELVFQIQIGFRLLSDSFQTGSLKNCKTSDFRLVQIDSSDFRLDFQITDWLQIGFRIISDCSLKNRKISVFILVQIGSDWLQNESLWIFVELFPLQNA